MDLTWLMIGFFLIVTVVFVAFAYCFPEWVGITGKKALEIQRHQSETKAELESTTGPASITPTELK